MIIHIISILLIFGIFFVLVFGVVTYIRHKIRANTDVLSNSDFYISNLIATQLINPETLHTTFIQQYRQNIDNYYPYLSQKIINRNLKEMQDYINKPELAQHYFINHLLNNTNTEQRLFIVARAIKLSAMFDPTNYFSQQLVNKDSDVNTNFNNMLDVLGLTPEQISKALKREDL